MLQQGPRRGEWTSHADILRKKFLAEITADSPKFSSWECWLFTKRNKDFSITEIDRNMRRIKEMR